MATNPLAQPGSVADVWVWSALGVLVVLLASRAWVVETGHATLGRTPAKVKVLSVACVAAAALLVTTVTGGGGGYLAYLVSHKAQAQELENARKAADDARRAATIAIDNGPDGTVPPPTTAEAPAPPPTPERPVPVRPKPVPVRPRPVVPVRPATPAPAAGAPTTTAPAGQNARSTGRARSTASARSTAQAQSGQQSRSGQQTRATTTAAGR